MSLVTTPVHPSLGDVSSARVGEGEVPALQGMLPLEPTRSYTEVVESFPNSSRDRKYLTILPSPLTVFGRQLRRCRRRARLARTRAVPLNISTFRPALCALGAAWPPPPSLARLGVRALGQPTFSGSQQRLALGYRRLLGEGAPLREMKTEERDGARGGAADQPDSAG